jgi:hypothetical protein
MYSTSFNFATLPLPSRYQRQHCVTDRYRILSNVTHGSSTLHIVMHRYPPLHTVTSTLPIVTYRYRYHTVTSSLLTVTALFIVFLSFLAIIQRLFLRKSATPKKFF